MSPESSQEYIQQVVMSLLGATEMYEEATKQQKRATASLLAAEAVILEVNGRYTDIVGTNENLQHLCAKSEPLFLVFTKI